MPYFATLDSYKLCSALPSEWIDEVATRYEGWLPKQFALVSALEIDARLSKRYAAPFAEPYPQAVEAWCARILDARVLTKRLINSSDDQWAIIFDDAKAAKAEILEAANGEVGLYDLPLRADTTSSGISKGAPKSYSEQSPYVWTTRQAQRGRVEDGNGEGTST